MSYTGLAERAAILQRDMKVTMGQFRPQNARTLATFEEGTRTEQGSMMGIQIPFNPGFAHGQTWYSPVSGDTSFKAAIKEQFRVMYGGVVYRNMNMRMEYHIQKDMENGKIPDSYIKERRRRIATHMMKKNWAAIGDGTGAIAFTAGAAGTVLTCTNDNNGRGRSKGSFRLKPSTSDDPLYYDAVNTATDAIVATFYITGKPSGTTATVGGYAAGSVTTLNAANLLICESGSYKKEMIGIGGHISNENRIYQGVDTSVDDFFKNPEIDAGDAAATPAMVHSAKGIALTRANDTNANSNLICHLTPGNYRTLAAYGYQTATKQYDVAKDTNVNFGLPNVYQDEDTVFVPDADYEDGYIDFRDKDSYFEYVQKEFGLLVQGGSGRHEYVGLYNSGSTESYENYNEAVNILWDGRGRTGKGETTGSPSSAVTIKNIAIPAENQVVYGI